MVKSLKKNTIALDFDSNEISLLLSDTDKERLLMIAKLYKNTWSNPYELINAAVTKLAGEEIARGEGVDADLIARSLVTYIEELGINKPSASWERG